MKTILKLITIILMALFSFKAYGKSVIIVWELILDFGNDNVFIHEVYRDKKYCNEKAKFISEVEKVKAYCIERKN